MTRKDFELIASVLHDVRLLAYAREWDAVGLFNLADADIAKMFAVALAETNPRFDRDRFIEATRG